MEKGIDSFIESLSENELIIFDNLVKEYSSIYGTNNEDMIKVIAYNETKRKDDIYNN